MVAWSGLLRSTGQILLRGSRNIPKKLPENGALQVRLMSEHRLMPMTPTRWQWYKTKDLYHLYFMVGAIPCFICAWVVQIFVGPATLAPIPEGYIPKHWEYYQHPISRFIARYLWNPPQQEYEKYLHLLWVESEIMQLRELQMRVENLMYERKDYQAYYYQPYDAKRVRSQAVQEHYRQENRRGSE